MTQLSSQRNRRWDVRGWRAALVAVAVLLVALAGLSWWERDTLFGTATEPGTPVPAAPDLTAAEAEYYAYVAPRLRELAAQAGELAALGRAKSRNLVELRRRGERIDDISQEVAGYTERRGVPARFGGAHERYLEGIEAVLRATEESRAAFMTFDWDRVARAVEVMETGARGLVSAVQELERVAGRSVATPVTET